MKKVNPIARAVRTSAFRSRIVKAKKGKGSYSRKVKDLPGDKRVA